MRRVTSTCVPCTKTGVKVFGFLIPGLVSEKHCVVLVQLQKTLLGIDMGEVVFKTYT